ncbi:unnamed protein product [Phytophthora fragariaefolia]|uniref:Unnamed protein product n=1 Tax=Phytophthora fragariaefolia TaxID=1490495 RepID=A0A9W7DDQ8_9STRA|nr:unnamed protein product [Phytophthora fragariaefolia]
MLAEPITVDPVPMDVDLGRVPRRTPPARPSEHRRDGKRRRLNSADDHEACKLAEHLQLVAEDGAEDQPQVPMPSAANTHSAPVLAVDVAVQDRTDAEQEACVRWGPPLPRTLVAARIADRVGEASPPRWGPPLSREVVVSRIAAKLDAAPAPRWGPPLPRDIVTSRIAGRPLPPLPAALLADEETKESEPPNPAHATTEESTAAEPMDVGTGLAMASDPPTMAPREWRLQFDGACRGAPNPGGAGALLYSPDGVVVWTGSRYLPGAKETNNTAEYTALLIGARTAADHGAGRLRIEGDSLLVIRQVKGLYATKSTRLRQLRNAVRRELARVPQHSLHHIDRQANAVADRLANRALDMKSDKIEYKEHPVAGACTTTMRSPQAGPPATPPPGHEDTEMADADSDSGLLADIDDSEVYARMRLEPGAVPARRPRLRLRQLADEEMEAASEAVECLSAALSAKITNAEDWATAEALPHLLRPRTPPAAATPTATGGGPPHGPPIRRGPRSTPRPGENAAP